MLEIKDILFHPIQLVDVELINLQLNKNRSILYNDTKNNQVKVEVKSWSEVTGDTQGEIFLNSKICLEDNGNVIFNIDMVYKGNCRTDKSNITQEDMKNFLEVQSIKLLWPYIREAVVDIMNKMGVKPIVLPTVDVLATMKKAVASEVNKENDKYTKPN